MAAALCRGVSGGGARLAFHVQAGNYDTDSLIEVLQGLRKFLGGAAMGDSSVRRWSAAATSVLVL